MQKRDLYYERIPTRLLRENVRYLGNILGKVIKEQEGLKFFLLVEKVRKLSKASKKKKTHVSGARKKRERRIQRDRQAQESRVSS